jgi:hypothetical protein
MLFIYAHYYHSQPLNGGKSTMNTLHRSLKISFPAIVILVWDEQLILPTFWPAGWTSAAQAGRERTERPIRYIGPTDDQAEKEIT